MRKVPFDLFRELKRRFEKIMKREELKYEIIPYFISYHPGCTDKDMQNLAEEVRSLGVRPEQVQDFTPTPMTLSTLIYYTGFDPHTGKKVYVARKPENKKRQKEYFFWYKKGDKSLKAIGKANGIRNQASGIRRQVKGTGHQ